MAKVAEVIFADTETHADLARVVNALLAAQECNEEDIEAMILFDGAGTKWIGELAKPEHRSHGLYESVKGQIAGACSFCARAFGAKEAIEAAGIPLLDEYKHHPSLAKLVAQGFSVVTF